MIEKHIKAKEEQGQNGVAYGFVIENLVCLTDPSVEMVPFITSNPKSFNALIFHHKGGNTKPSRKLSIIKEKKSALVLRLIIYGINKRMESNTHENHPIPQPKQGRGLSYTHVSMSSASLTAVYLLFPHPIALFKTEKVVTRMLRNFT